MAFAPDASKVLKRREEFHRGLGKIALAAEIDGGTGEFRRVGPEGEQRLAVPRCHDIEPERHLRRVMAFQLARRSDLGFRPRHGERMTEDRLDLLSRQSANPKQRGLVADHADHCRFEPARARTSIEDHRGDIAKLELDMFGQGRADPPRSVGAGCGDGKTGLGEQRARHRMRRRPERDRVEACADEFGDLAILRPRQHQRQRPRPEGFRELSRNDIDHGMRFRLLQPQHMHDQRIEARPLFRREDLGDSGCVQRIGAEPIDSLGRKRDDIAARKRLRGLLDGVLCRFGYGHATANT